MRAWIWEIDHPSFPPPERNGKFTIKDVPPGITLWWMAGSRGREINAGHGDCRKDRDPDFSSRPSDKDTAERPPRRHPAARRSVKQEGEHEDGLSAADSLRVEAREIR